MKKYLLILLFILPTASIQAQSFPPTTEEEYNMGSVGYKMYLSMGVELTKGYSVKDLATYEYGDRKATFKGLYRGADKIPCATLLIYNKLRGAPEYYCIPTTDAPEILWDRFRTSVAGENDSKTDQMQFFTFAIAKLYMDTATK
jgi:hypothetical protein